MEHIINKTINGSGDSDAHLMSLYGMCIGTKSKNILELGVRDGVTTLPLLMAAKETNGKVVSVDINPTNFQPPEDLVEYWEFVQMDALEYLKKIDKTCVLDFVYVDDWHSYEHVKSELEELDKCVSPKSLIILHDLMYGNWSPHYHVDLTMDTGQWANGGPYRAVAELNKQFWEFATIPVCNGLTILRKKYSNKYHY
jgi:predicted O-methyltransferase YrrM